jgi:hypothetical protein
VSPAIIADSCCTLKGPTAKYGDLGNDAANQSNVPLAAGAGRPDVVLEAGRNDVASQDVPRAMT